MTRNRIKILFIAASMVFAQHAFAASTDVNEKSILDSVVKNIQQKIMRWLFGIMVPVGSRASF